MPVQTCSYIKIYGLHICIHTYTNTHTMQMMAELSGTHFSSCTFTFYFSIARHSNPNRKKKINSPRNYINVKW